MVATAPIPDHFRTSAASLAGCVGGACDVTELAQMLREAGFGQIQIRPRNESRAFIKDWMPGTGIEEYIVSATIEAIKPGPNGDCCSPACCT